METKDFLRPLLMACDPRRDGQSLSQPYSLVPGEATALARLGWDLAASAVSC